MVILFIGWLTVLVIANLAMMVSIKTRHLNLSTLLTVEPHGREIFNQVLLAESDAQIGATPYERSPERIGKLTLKCCSTSINETNRP